MIVFLMFRLTGKPRCLRFSGCHLSDYSNTAMNADGSNQRSVFTYQSREQRDDVWPADLPTRLVA